MISIKLLVLATAIVGAVAIITYFLMDFVGYELMNILDRLPL